MGNPHPNHCCALVCPIHCMNKAANDVGVNWKEKKKKKIENSEMDIEGKARQAEMWSESKDGAGKEERMEQAAEVWWPT